MQFDVDTQITHITFKKIDTKKINIYQFIYIYTYDTHTYQIYQNPCLTQYYHYYYQYSLNIFIPTQCTTISYYIILQQQQQPQFEPQYIQLLLLLLLLKNALIISSEEKKLSSTQISPDVFQKIPNLPYTQFKKCNINNNKQFIVLKTFLQSHIISSIVHLSLLIQKEEKKSYLIDCLNFCNF
eukprot:TRINITY_DN4106_c2_g1_i1.p1 TRINITY_DN4106_c2_g1~~TRINITY_DN4106_c2_g1_i1.p1  ORF type:complete len:212 (+),score=-19.79 TRINITY_DN4106_c2_g1_i1:89-637(+)